MNPLVLGADIQYLLTVTSLVAVPTAFGGALLLVILGLFRKVPRGRLALFALLTIPVAFLIGLFLYSFVQVRTFQVWTTATAILVLLWVGVVLALWLKPADRSNSRQ